MPNGAVDCECANRVVVRAIQQKRQIGSIPAYTRGSGSPREPMRGSAERMTRRSMRPNDSYATATGSRACRSAGNASAARKISPATAASIAKSGWKSPWVRCTQAMIGTAIALAPNDTT